jgi:hypothetical protein
MKLAWKLGLSFGLAAILALAFITTTSEPASALGGILCPTTHCPQNLSGYDLLYPCTTGECVGWAYQKGTNPPCHVSALSGN